MVSYHLASIYFLVNDTNNSTSKPSKPELSEESQAHTIIL